MRNQPIPLVTGFYRDEDRPFSQQDVCNYLPCKAEAPGTRSPLMLKTPPGLYPYVELLDVGPVRGIHDCEGRLFQVAGNTLYRISNTQVAIPIGTVPGTGRVDMDHNQISGGNELTIVNGSAGYVYNTVTGDYGRITDTGFPGSPLIGFLDGYMIGLDPAGRFAFNSRPANALEYNTLDRWTSEYRPDRLVSFGRSNGELLLLSANSGEFFQNTGASEQPFRSKRIFMDKGCAGPYTVVEADNTVFWLGSDGYFYQLDGYGARRISTRPIEQAIRGQDWWNAFGFLWESEGHTLVCWTFLNGQTWGWDTSQQEWSRRESYGLNRWRVNCTTRSNGQWYAGDFQTGRTWNIRWNYPWEGDVEFVSSFSQPVMHDNQNDLIHNRLEIVMDVGQPDVEPGEFPVQPVGPTISGDAPNGSVGIAYAGYAYTLTPGDAPISTVVVDSGAIPDGLTFDPSGEIVPGSPTEPGTFSFTLRVTDTNGLSSTLDDTVYIQQVLLATGEDALDDPVVLRVPDSLDWTAPYGTFPGSLTIAISMLGVPGRGLAWNQNLMAKTDDYGLSWQMTSANLTGATGAVTGAYKDGLLLIAGGATTMFKSSDNGSTTAAVTGSPNSNWLAWCGERLISAYNGHTTLRFSDSTPAQFIAGTQSFSTGGTHGLDHAGTVSVHSFNGCWMLGARIGSKPALAITEDGVSITNVTFSGAANGYVSAIVGSEVEGVEIWVIATTAGEMFWSDDRFQTYAACVITGGTPITVCGIFDGIRYVFAGAIPTDYVATSLDGKNFAVNTNTSIVGGITAMCTVPPP